MIAHMHTPDIFSRNNAVTECILFRKNTNKNCVDENTLWENLQILMAIVSIFGDSFGLNVAVKMGKSDGMLGPVE